MNEQQTAQVQDVMSIGTRVSWGAIWAGSILALALLLLLTTLGTATGLSLSERVAASTLQTSTIAWALLIVCSALFVGGMCTSLLTVGENKTEAVLHGILVWALVAGILFLLGAVGLRSGFHPTSPFTHSGSPGIASGSGSTLTIQPADLAAQPQRIAEHEEMTRRIAWCSFAGTWLSMLAAAIGALLGAGPTFRVGIVSGQKASAF